MKSTGSNDRANGLENAADEWGEKVVTLSLPSFIYFASGHQYDLSLILKLSFELHALKDGWMDRWGYMPLHMSYTFTLYYSSPPI